MTNIPDDYENFENLPDEEIKKKSFVGADLRDKSFRGCDLTEWDFSGANIGGTNFEGANLTGAIFQDVKSDFPNYWEFFVKVVIVLLGFISGFITSYSFSVLLGLGEFNEIIAGLDGVSDIFIKKFKAPSTWSQSFFFIYLGALVWSFIVGMDITLLGALTVIISISISITAIFPPATAIITSYGLIALLGIISGFLVQAESAVLTRVAGFSIGRKIGPFNLFVLFCWFVSVLGLIFGVLFARNGHYGLSVFLGCLLLGVADYLMINVQDERYSILDFFALNLLKRGPITNFQNAQLKNTNFKNADLKEYATALNVENCDDDTLNSLMSHRKNPGNRLEKVLNLTLMGTIGKGIRPLVVQVIDRYMSGTNFSVGRDFYGTLNLGEISGNVTNAIKQLPTSPEADGSSSIKKHLTELQKAIESEDTLSEKVKANALQQVEALANSVKSSEEGERRMLASGAFSFLKSLNDNLANTAKLAGSLKVLLPMIGGFFGLV